MAFSLALYLAFPFIQSTCTPLVLRGVGIRTCDIDNKPFNVRASKIQIHICIKGLQLSFFHVWKPGCVRVPLCGHLHLSPAELGGDLTSIFWASSEGLKLDLMTTLTSSLVRPTSRTRGMTLNGRMMSLVVRYLQEKCEFNTTLPSCSPKSFSVTSHNIYFMTNWSWQKQSTVNNIILPHVPQPPALFCHIQTSIYWPHELIFSIGGDEADATLRVKLTEAHTLVESAVVDGNGLLPTAGRGNTWETRGKKRVLVLFYITDQILKNSDSHISKRQNYYYYYYPSTIVYDQNRNIKHMRKKLLVARHEPFWG